MIDKDEIVSTEREQEREIPPSPTGAGRRGGAFWRRVLGTWELDASETEILRSVVVLMGRCEALTAAILRDGDVLDGPRVNPCVPELRQCSAALGRLVSMLQLPDQDGTAMPSASSVAKAKGARAQRAARAEAAGSVSEMASRAAWLKWHPQTGA